MKTLYININGEDVQSTESLVVIGDKNDAIIDSFYVALGEEIVTGSHVRNISHRTIVENYASDKPEEFESVLQQWEEVKEILLSNDPSGKYSVQLPSEYLRWLRYNDNDSYRDVFEKKYADKKEVSVSIDIDSLYLDSLASIRRKVVRFWETKGNSEDIEEFVINDNYANGKSKFVRDIREKLEGIAFLRFNQYEEQVKESVLKVGQGDDAGLDGSVNSVDEKDGKSEIFSLFGVVLGETEGKDLDGYEDRWRHVQNQIRYTIIHPRRSDNTLEHGIRFYMHEANDKEYPISAIWFSKDIEMPKKLERLLNLSWGMQEKDWDSFVQMNGMTENGGLYAFSPFNCAITKDKKYEITLHFNKEESLTDILIYYIEKCWDCGSKKVSIEQFGHSIKCNHCGMCHEESPIDFETKYNPRFTKEMQLEQYNALININGIVLGKTSEWYVKHNCDKSYKIGYEDAYVIGNCTFCCHNNGIDDVVDTVYLDENSRMPEDYPLEGQFQYYDRWFALEYLEDSVWCDDIGQWDDFEIEGRIRGLKITWYFDQDTSSLQSICLELKYESEDTSDDTIVNCPRCGSSRVVVDEDGSWRCANCDKRWDD